MSNALRSKLNTLNTHVVQVIILKTFFRLNLSFWSRRNFTTITKVLVLKHFQDLPLKNLMISVKSILLSKMISLSVEKKIRN